MFYNGFHVVSLSVIKGNLYYKHYLICMSGSVEQIVTKALGSIFGRPCLSGSVPHLAGLLNGL